MNIVKLLKLNKKSSVFWASIFISSFLFFLVSYFLYISFLTFFSVKHLESLSQVTTYFKDTLSEKQILEIKKELDSLPEVQETIYISKDQALQIFYDSYKEEPLLTESINSGIFPASLDVRVKKTQDIQGVVDKINTYDGVEEVDYLKDAIEKFKNYIQGIRSSIYILIGVLGVICFMIIFVINAISLPIKKFDWLIRT